MKKLFFVFFIMFLSFGNLGNIESSITSNEHVQPIPNFATAATIVQYDVARPEKRFYWGNDIIPIELATADNKKQIMCMAKNIFFEAATESTAGQLAVTQVVLNRVKSKYFPNTVCGVIEEAKRHANGLPKRDQCQFSWYCDGRGDEPRESRLWTQAQELAKHIFLYKDKYVDITDGATHYHAKYIDDPRWARADRRTATIDQHHFFRL